MPVLIVRLEGFTVSNYFNLIAEFERDMTRWIHEGKITWKETVEHGIEAIQARDQRWAAMWARCARPPPNEAFSPAIS